MVTNVAYGTERVPGLADLFDAGGASLTAYGNAKMVAYGQDRATLFLKNTTNGGDIQVVGGTAMPLIWGTEGAKWGAGSNIGAYIMGTIRLQEPGGGLGDSYIYSLSYRLGNCAASPKTLIVKIGGTDRTLTFDQNYMTADGSPYTVTTVPAVAYSAIVTTMNAALAAWGAAGNVNVGPFALLAPNDCKTSLVNTTLLAIKRGVGVVKSAAGTVRLSQAGEIPFGIAAEHIAPGEIGEVIRLDKSDFSAIAVLGSTSVTPGTMYNTAADGGFVATVDPLLAKIVAADAWTVSKYQAI